MSSLTYLEKRLLEQLFGMASGYVLDFSNRTFQEFMLDVAGVDIYVEKYNYNSGSKANRLRAFWTEEPDATVARVIEALTDLAAAQSTSDPKLLQAAKKAVDRLRGADDLSTEETATPRRRTHRFASPPPPRDVPPPGSIVNRDSPPSSKRNYEVALSFAGEQRPYVSCVASALRDAGVSVFYDEYEDLWGKDLTVELERVYRSGSRYVVIFVSREYVGKSWTNHERQHALAGRIERQDDSILPVHFDETRLPGLPSSIAHLDIRHLKPEELATRILSKLQS